MSISYPDANTFRVRRSGSSSWITVPLDGPLTVQQLANFPAKVTIGEPTKGAHPLLSTWAFDGLTGGHGIAKHRNTTSSSRYRIGLADTRNADFWASPRSATTYTGTANAFMPHNDVVVSGTRRFYGSFGTDLYVWDESGPSMTDTTANLSAAAVNPGVAFGTTLYIPMGTTGYARWTGSVLTNVAASGSQPAARDFCKIRTMLFCLDTSGQIWSSTDGSTWTGYGTYGTLDAGINGRRLEMYKNGFGDPTLHIVTDCGLYAFDPAGPDLYELEMQLPPHPYQGLALRRFRDQLWVSGGMGTYMWNGSVVDPTHGLDRNHGLPNDYRGRILDLSSDLNNLFALVFGDTYHSVQAWTGEGWMMLWQGADSSTPSKMVMSSAQGGYRLWWGYGNNAVTMPFPNDFANAEQLAQASATGFERAWFLETGEQAFEMDGFTKILLAIEWEEYSQTDGFSKLRYRTDQSQSFADIPGYVFPASGGSESSASWRTFTYQFGYDATNARWYGEPCDWVELRWDGQGSSSYTGPDMIKNVVLTFQKVIEGYRAWTTTFNLKRLHDNNQSDIADLIDALVLANEYCDFQYQEDIYRVRFGSWGGADESGQGRHGGIRNVSIIEVPTAP